MSKQETALLQRVCAGHLKDASEGEAGKQKNTLYTILTH